jgi:hypothetical protein
MAPDKPQSAMLIAIRTSLQPIVRPRQLHPYQE